jgi:hypothetical protein
MSSTVSPVSSSRGLAVDQGALSRRAAYRSILSAALDATRRCGEEGTVIVLVEPPSGRAEVRAAFDEIDEKLHLSGIDLRFEVDYDAGLTAIFEPVRVSR